jgi:hypothetical protein
MRRSVSIAILAAVLAIGLGSIVEGRRGFALNAQEKASTMEVKIDNFSFGLTALTVPVGDHGDVDQS